MFVKFVQERQKNDTYPITQLLHAANDGHGFAREVVKLLCPKQANWSTPANKFDIFVFSTENWTFLQNASE